MMVCGDCPGWKKGIDGDGKPKSPPTEEFGTCGPYVEKVKDLNRNINVYHTTHRDEPCTLQTRAIFVKRLERGATRCRPPAY